MVQLVRRDDGQIEERQPDRSLASEAVTVLDVYGHLFYAGARTLSQLLPSPAEATRPVVVLRLRSLASAGATLLDVLADFGDQLAATGGRLYLAGVRPEVRAQIERTNRLDLGGTVTILEATPVRGESTLQAVAESRAWLTDGPSGSG